MPKFLTIGYGDRAGYDKTPEAIRQMAHQNDDVLAAKGAVVGVAGKPVQVRNPEGSGIVVTEGAFQQSALPIAGFAIIDAAGIEDAVDMVSGSPCAVAHGVIEIWPLQGNGND